MIAAAGDSITFGHGASKPANSWPSIVAKKLGSRFMVHDLGRPSLTVQASTAEAYSRTEQYQHLRSTKYDAYIWMLGTNDARYSGWVDACVTDSADFNPADADSSHLCQFERDYLELIYTTRASSTSPIFLVTPPPVPLNCAYSVNATIVNSILPNILARVCAAIGSSCTLVDAFGAFGGHATRPFPAGGCTPLSTASDERCRHYCNAQTCDPLHPSDDGYALLARLIFGALDARLHASSCGSANVVMCATARPALESLLRAASVPALFIAALLCLLAILRFRYRPSVRLISGLSLGRSGSAMLLA